MIKRPLTSMVSAVAFVIAASGAAFAQASFSVDPLLIELNGQTNSAVLSITNPSAKEIRFEIKAYAWDQTPPDGTMQLTATQDVVIFPPLVSIKPRMTQRVRVGTTAVPGAIEKSYRIMVEELPTGDVKPVANQVAIRTRIGIPVFIESTKAVRSGSISNVAIKDRTISVTLNNTGTKHVMVDEVVIRGMVAPDEQSFEQSMQGWYVLAGKSRTWQYVFKPTQCRGTKYIEIEAFGHDKVLKNRVDVPAGACNP
jgi:fimbrial chaperone protein